MTFDFKVLMNKWGVVTGGHLRPRTLEQKHATRDALREHAEGFRVSMLSGNVNLTRSTGLPNPKDWMDIKNGALDCRLLSWQL